MSPEVVPASSITQATRSERYRLNREYDLLDQFTLVFPILSRFSVPCRCQYRLVDIVRFLRSQDGPGTCRHSTDRHRNDRWNELSDPVRDNPVMRTIVRSLRLPDFMMMRSVELEPGNQVLVSIC